MTPGGDRLRPVSCDWSSGSREVLLEELNSGQWFRWEAALFTIPTGASVKFSQKRNPCATPRNNSSNRGNWMTFHSFLRSVGEGSTTRP